VKLFNLLLFYISIAKYTYYLIIILIMITVMITKLGRSVRKIHILLVCNS